MTQRDIVGMIMFYGWPYHCRCRMGPDEFGEDMQVSLQEIREQAKMFGKRRAETQFFSQSWAFEAITELLAIIDRMEVEAEQLRMSVRVWNRDNEPGAKTTEDTPDPKKHSDPILPGTTYCPTCGQRRKASNVRITADHDCPERPK